MIERAFELGWGGALIKTLAQVEPDTLHNVSPRIQGIRSGGRLMDFTNIELGTQKSVSQVGHGSFFLRVTVVTFSGK